ncbi:hypothetical protein [Spirosoma harenae]
MDNQQMVNTFQDESPMGKAFVIDQDLAEELIQALNTCQQEINALRQERKQMEQDKLFGIRQACEYLGGIKEETLLYYRRLGLAYYKKKRGGVWYRKGDIDDWLASEKVARHTRKG